MTLVFVSVCPSVSGSSVGDIDRKSVLSRRELSTKHFAYTRRVFPNEQVVALADGSSLSDGTAREREAKLGNVNPLSAHVLNLIAEQKRRPIFDTTSSNVPRCTVEAQNSNPARFLLQADCEMFGAAGRAAALLRDRCDEIIATARKAVILEHPGIDKPGGSLHPQFRADACWRDLKEFLRVTSYGCVCDLSGNASFLNAEGCSIMNEIYDELDVPRAAILTGLRAASDAATSLSGADEDAKQCIRAAFNVLLLTMEQLNSRASQGLLDTPGNFQF